MTWTRVLVGLVLVAGAGGGLLATGHLDLPRSWMPPWPKAARSPTTTKNAPEPGRAPAVTVTRATPADFTETVLVTGSLIARDEILVGPEVDGLRVVEVLADEGDRVHKGQVLAKLVSDTLDAQLAQNTASLAKADAAIAQARSTIASAEARLVEARNAFDRAQPLTKSGYLSESSMDQRESARRTAEAALTSAKDGLRLSEAEKGVVEAQRRELSWRRARTAITAPADGLVSRRIARVGGYASGIGDPMFRIVAKGEVEFDAEVPELRLPKVREGQVVDIEAAGAGKVKGTVRLVSPEVDRATRLGRIRVFIGDQPGLRIGSFARGRIATASSRGLAVPISAVLYGPQGASVQVVADGRIRTKAVALGLVDGNRIEVKAGLLEGDRVVARSGTFLREGDAVRPMAADDKSASEAG